MSDNRNDGQWASWLIYAMDIYCSLVVLQYGGVAAHLFVVIESENESLASFLVNCPCERCDTLESPLTRDVPRRIALERWFGGLALDFL